MTGFNKEQSETLLNYYIEQQSMDHSYKLVLDLGYLNGYKCA